MNFAQQNLKRADERDVLPGLRVQKDAIDGMRGLAVLLVFLSHTSGRGMALAPWLQFHGIGHVGVYLFFVLSAYLLTKNLLVEFDPLYFYLRRFFRIAPLYYLVLIGVVVFQGLGNFTPDYLYVTEGSEFAHFVFYRGDGIFWTIAAEFSFYFFLPLVVWLIGKYGLRWIIVFSIIYFFCFAANLLGFAALPLKLVDIGKHHSQYLDVFACGVIAAFVSFKLPQPTTALFFWGGVISALFLVSSNFLNMAQPLYHIRWLSLVYGAVFAAGVVGADQGNPLITRALNIRLLVIIGKCAFGWYLLHFAIFYLVNLYVPAPPAARFLIALVSCTFVAALARICIEQPFIRLGRRLEGFLPKLITRAG